MASKGPKSKFDHEPRTKRQKALEPPKDPGRPKTHWDHVLEEMVWLSKDFESERKWKLALAKKVAIRASKGMLDQATRGERRVKVVYKHQLEVGEKKKKAQNKQLEFLLGQTERYSTMLAENLVASPVPGHSYSNQEHLSIQNFESKSDLADNDEDYDAASEGQLEDDEHTIEEDEALITAEERQEELAALHSEIDLPLEELLKRYGVQKESCENSPEKKAGGAISTQATGDSQIITNLIGNENDVSTEFCTEGGSIDAASVRRCEESNGRLSISEKLAAKVDAVKARNTSASVQELGNNHTAYDFSDEQEDGDFVLANGDEKDDETTLSEEECIANAESNNATDEIALLQKENEIPIEELLARYKKQTTNVELQPVPVEVSDEPNERSPVMSPVSREQEAQPDQNSDEAGENESRIADAAAAARSAQPTGNTFSTTKVRTKHPFLLKFSLREYQHIGLDWLVTMYEKRLNGILADEMGLGKTIMTIALLAHLACEKGIWGPHLIVVPTSVMLNWETEFLKWCPAFKILTYFGCAKERKIKRQGWLKPNSFHICITTYRLVIQDSKIFKRKKWKYLILDEAHLIKNWKSQRWQTLLNFNTKRRILLTGTPLQNDLMELWSLMHFLMPHIFQSHQEFKDWFSNPISGMVDGQEKVNKEVVDRLHNVLRPFILRRLKRDVEKQLPMKHEHVIYCRLSRRQRNLYEDYIASSETQATLASSNFFGMISVIMQLRKVCNHPDLFEGRPIVSSFDMNAIDTQLSSSVCSIFTPSPFSEVDLSGLGLLFTHLDFYMNSWESDEVQAIATPSSLIEGRASLENYEQITSGFRHMKKAHGGNIFEEIQQAIFEERIKEAKERAKAISWWNSLRCRKKPIYSMNMRELVTIRNPLYGIDRTEGTTPSYLNSSVLANIILSPVERFHKMVDQVESFMFAIPAARAPTPVCWCSRTGSSLFVQPGYKERCAELLSPLLTPIRPAIVRRQVYFPDRRLIQFDCGKLQELSILLRRLKSEGHRALIFTQMTKMLDVLEAFISLYGYTYMRLDGSTQPEERQTLMQRFNTNPKYFLFILSTRSGGVGVNLVGADTVIFYDSDWNPAMDQQAQDRCHRIGQTREVHIYRLISESTIEENILKKANQKRALDDLVIQSGGYNTDFFKKLDPIDLFSGHRTIPSKQIQMEDLSDDKIQVSFSNADVDAALKNAEDEADYMALKKVEQEEAVENQEFTEEAVGRLDDDEVVNEEDGHVSAVNTGLAKTSNREHCEMITAGDMIGEGAITLAGQEDDVDMLADVKQMAAAAAAAGQEILSFESQLRPIDRYAVRFLELWDPIIDKAAVESQVRFEETEWELDRIEKLKEDMEAEIDDDEEPFVYEQWDAEFATEVYKQQVEALAKHQLMEELEMEAKEKERADHEYSDSMQNDYAVTPKPKSKKKKRKTKFKSLKRGALVSESRAVKEESPIEFVSEPMSIDDDDDPEFNTSSDRIPAPTSVDKKRKAGPSSNNSKKAKKTKKTPAEISPSALDFNMFSKQQDEPKDIDIEHKPISRTKMGGKISITSMPVKRVLTIRPEKMKKKGSMWSKDCFPSPDTWMPAEDAVLCAVVHEYGPHWSLVSEVLYGITAGGYYRGIFRHPVHCCERFRELFQRYILSSTEIQNDKLNNAGSGKSLLRVTEDNVRLLLGAVSELPDNEPLIQKHFFALLSSVWRASSGRYKKHSNSTSEASFYPGARFLPSAVNHISRTVTAGTSSRMNFANLSTSKKLVAAALHDVDATSRHDGVAILGSRGEDSSVMDELVISLELPDRGTSDPVMLPSIVNVSICGPEQSPSTCTDAGGNKIRYSLVAENRFRTSCESRESRGEDCMAPNSSFSSSLDVELRMPLKVQSLGKHKLPISEPVKSAKSKVRKTITESSVVQCAVGDPVFRQVMVATRDSDSRFDMIAPDVGTTSYESGSSFDLEDLLTSDLTCSEMSMHYYDPGLTSGLEDYSSFSDFTDIG
ncbi:hypothetical protein DCAR_0207484 [Daucus carota subsp. sativus]|uniref:DNA helicase n=1 Tax=Daucus carota subsp. sativus TaxID=79200 RepID=A0AAF0WEQ5_DAUCS|nr:hypothetical protein DCAR_0207484 [Daucus carota subsp. sativus]